MQKADAIVRPPPPGFPLPPGFPPAGPPQFPPGSQGRPPFPPFMPPGTSPGPGGFPIPPMQGVGSSPAPPPQFVPAQMPHNSPPMPPPAAQSPLQVPPIQSQSNEVKGLSDTPRKEGPVRKPVLTLPNPSLAQSNAEFKKPTDLKVKDPNFCPVYCFILLFLRLYSWKFSICRTSIERFMPSTSTQSLVSAHQLHQRNHVARNGPARKISYNIGQSSNLRLNFLFDLTKFI